MIRIRNAFRYTNIQKYMNSFYEIEKQYQGLQDHSDTSLVDLRHLLLDIEELVSSADYQTLALDQRRTLQARRKELMRRIQEQENGGAALADTTNGQGQEFASQSESIFEPATAPPESEREHNPADESQMEMAEKLFYSGRSA